jgi:hypothetical protein
MRREVLLTLVALSGLIRIGYPQGAEFRFQVRHDHDFKSCRGELVFSDEQVRFNTDHVRHARDWHYQDIQQVGLLGPSELSIVTFEDRKWIAGKDLRFHFKLIEGTIPEQLNSFLQGKLTRPLVTSLVQATQVSKFELPAKHMHAWGGCQGVLKFSEESVSYVSNTPEDSRYWLYEELVSMGSTGQFQLRLTAVERTRSEIGSQKNFIFELKSRMTPQMYDSVWWKVNQSKIAQIP